MTPDLKEQLRNLVLHNPKEIKSVLLFMGKVCEEQRFTSKNPNSWNEWSDRQNALEAISEVLHEDEDNA